MIAFLANAMDISYIPVYDACDEIISTYRDPRLKSSVSGGSGIVGYRVSAEKLWPHLQLALERKTTKYLTMMPWEQLNNQIIEMKAACATSMLLDRTLILPLLGWRMKDVWNFSYNVLDFHWEPTELYFSYSKLQSLPCKVITMDNFRFLYPTIGYDSSTTTMRPSNHREPNGTPPQFISFHFNPVAHATSTDQLVDYYGEVIGWDAPRVQCTPEQQEEFLAAYTIHQKVVQSLPCQWNLGKKSQLGSGEIIATYGNDPSTLLAFGSMFWFYGFDRFQGYPLTKYENYMDHPVYRAIISHLEFVPEIGLALEESLSKMSGLFNAIHVRRGDYYNKCVKIKNDELRKHCYPPAEEIVSRVASSPGRRFMRPGVTNLYIADRKSVV